ncbi:MAG: YmdB family metallophosphoesterase [Clostridiaceae bacterium]|nr:YmdB family metallophosphoesterase [Clostridiaceae bacterium]
MTDKVKVLFFGDLTGKPGRFALRDFLSDLKSKNQLPDFVIANVENASHGFGLTPKNYGELLEYGVDCMTSGNHIFDKKDLLSIIEDADKLVRPINYPKNMTYGKGSRIFEKDDYKIGVINVLGRVFMTPVDSQWEIVEEEIKKLKEITPIVVVDFHAEATAEKVCFGKFCAKLGVSAFLGTHTHIQTADEHIENGMAYITDAGFCGCIDSVIGMDYATSLNRFLTALPERYEVAENGSVQINAVEFEIDKNTGFATSIKRIYSISKEEEKDKDNEV